MTKDDRPLALGSRPTVLKADRAYRRRVFLVYGTSVLLAFVSVVALTEWAFPMLDEHIRRIGDAAGLRLLRTIGIVSTLPVLGAFIYLFRIGRRIQMSEQLPAPGAKVIRDTDIIYGRAARRRGTLVVAVSIFGMLAIVLFVVALIRLTA